jgi:hypothetical protein
MAGGRPPLYSDELADKVLDGLAEGNSLVDVCADPDLPSVRTVMQWAADNEEFSQRYVRAREAQAEVMDDKILKAADKAKEDPQAARVQIDAYKWRAAKLAPKKYGDATTIKHADADGEKIEMGEVERATRIAAILRQAEERKAADGSD